MEIERTPSAQDGAGAQATPARNGCHAVRQCKQMFEMGRPAGRRSAASGGEGPSPAKALQSIAQPTFG
jgi:hypothetical protein